MEEPPLREEEEEEEEDKAGPEGALGKSPLQLTAEDVYDISYVMGRELMALGSDPRVTQLQFKIVRVLEMLETLVNEGNLTVEELRMERDNLRKEVEGLRREGSAAGPEWLDSTKRRPRKKKRERDSCSHGQQCQQQQGGEDNHKETVLFPIREADVDLRLQLRSQTQKTTHKDDFHNHLSVPCVPTALASSLPLKAVRGGRGEAFSLAAELNTPEWWARAGEVVKEIEKAEEKNSGATCSPTSTTQGAPNT
ncbi:RILP-like protein 2 isoform X1 [Cervus elaphus]|uniref:RILP-like protein 2 isoform X1 n=1 Tax=Cervus elaphus TaxID=9860 RepID=UPI001CC2DA6A|nr:RILP-like protein 2 isoform X1 [Cervus elaphus]